MVAIVAGNGLGLERGSGNVLGSSGQLGSAFLGRGGDAVTVNAATGNLIIANRDEFLVGRGPDSSLNRTYNSQGQFTDDNGDNWRISAQRRIYSVSGTLYRTDWDGSETVYTWDAVFGAYVSREGSGAYDTLLYDGANWVWKDGDTGISELYSPGYDNRLVSQTDRDGNTVTYSYAGSTGNLVRVTTADGNYTDLTWTGSNLTSLVTTYTDIPTGTTKTLTRTRYTYGGGNRLAKVAVDLSPEDNSIADGRVYETSYTYDGAGRVNAISQTDGTYLAIAYDGSGRVASFTQTVAAGVTRTTTFSYDAANRITTITDPLSNVYKMAYDSANRLTRLDEPAPVSGGNPSIRTFEYNGNGDVTRALTFDAAANVGNPSLAVDYAVYRYDTAGNVLEQVDGAKASVFFAYGASNELLTRTRFTGLDANGLADGGAPTGGMVTRYVYDSELHLRFIVTPEGRVTEYRYDAPGRQTAQIDYSGTLYAGSSWTEAALASWVSGTADKTQAQRADTTYDFRGNVSTVTRYAGTDSAGAGLTTTDYSRVTYVYDQAGNLRSKITAGYNALGGEPTAAVETFVYDGLGRAINATSALGQTVTTTYGDSARTTTVTAPNTATRTLTYNIAGNLLSETVSGAGITTATTSNAYDAFGRLRVATDQAGYRTYQIYDRQGRLAATISANGAMVEYRYDGADRLVAQVAYANLVSSANLTTLANASVNTEAAGVRPTASSADRWQWNVYDKAGRLIETIDALGAATVFEYDGAGRVVRTTRYANAIAAATVSGFKTTPPGSQVLPTADAMRDRITRSFYDNDGNLAATLDAESYLAEYVYDKAGRQVEAIGYYNKPGSTYLTGGTLAQIKSTLSTHARDQHSYTLYDGSGRVRASIDGEGNVTRFHYSVQGTLDQEIAGQKVTPNTAYTLATLPTPGGQLETTRYYYNAAGLVTSRIRTLASGNLTATYSYDTKGRLTSSTDAAGHVANTSYDSLGRIVTDQDDIGTIAGVYATTTYQYDTRGNLVKVTDALGNAGYNYYDERSRLVLAIDAEGYATRTAYNTFGEIASVTRYYSKATGIGNVSVQPTVTTHARDETTSFQRDLLGRVTVVTNAENQLEYTYYNALGDMIATHNTLGGITSYSYTKRGQLYYAYSNRTVSRSDGSTAASGAYGNLYVYDAFGNVIQQVEGYGLSERRDTIFTYDRANRLVQKTLPSIMVYNPSTGGNTLTARSEYYSYDARGNLIESRDALGARTLFYYDEANRTIARISPVGTHKTYSYDGNGNVTVERTYDTATSLPATPGGTPPAPSGTPRTVYYTYDRNDQLIGTQINAIVAGEVVGANYVLGTYNLATARQYDAMGRVVRETDARGGSVYLYYDRNGREVARVDQAKFLTTWTRDSEGNVLEERRYATQFGGTPVVGTVPSVSTSSNDRVTQFTYDRMGRRLTETRLAVAASTVSGNSVATASQSATIAYTYNALGEVLTRTEATGEVTTYQYDSYGRLTRRIDPAHADQTGTSVQLSDQFYYDGLDNLVHEKQSTYATGSNQRITTYVYGAGGSLASVTNPAGETRNYYYSIRGELLRDDVTTKRADTSTNVTFYNYKSYDAAGRISTEQSASYDAASGWSYGLISTNGYSTFGEVVSRSLKPQGGSATVTEQMVYDAAGRVVKSNAGDGVWKFFVHDRNGNVTLAMTSTAAANLAGWSQASAYNSVVSGGTLALSSFNQTYLTASIVVYDKRDMAVQTYEPNRTIANGSNVATTATQTLSTQRWYNAFGEVTQERSARGYDTNYSYNTMGRLTQVQAPAVTVVSEAGTSASQRPTENYAYDVAGRLVGAQNANGFWTTRVLLAGSGHDGSEALVTAEYRPDSSVWQTAYDVYGNARKLTDGLGRITTQDFDAADRLVTVTRPSGIVDNYGYDALGRVTRHWNSAIGSPIYGDPPLIGYGPYGEPIYGPAPVVGYNPYYERTDYDAQGRVIATKNFAGDLTTYSYSWNGAAATASMGTFGAWTKTVSTIADRYSGSDAIVATTETTDAFGHLLARGDMGGRTYGYAYNAAGQLAGQTSSAGQSLAYTYYNTGKMATMADNASVPAGYSSANIDATYTYDADGNRTYEKLQGTTYYYDPYMGYSGSSTVTLQEGKGTYDAMGRLLTFTDAGASGNGAASVTNSYDAAGNVRRTLAVHSTINNDQSLGGQVTDDYWYKYDALNRMVLIKGSLVSGQIVRNTADARTITYNAAGERASQSRTLSYFDPYAGYYAAEQRETYAYNADGLLTQVSIGTGTIAYYSGTMPTSLAAPTSYTLRAQTAYDAAGRVTDYKEFAENGTTVNYNRYAIGYDARGNVTAESSTLRRYESDGNLYVNYSTITNTYAGTGALYTSAATNYRYKNGTTYQDTPDTLTTYAWAWWDAAQQATMTYKPNTSQSTTWGTTYAYDANGHLTSAYVSDGRPRTITYVNDASGQVLVRRETDNTANGDPKQVWWYFDGRQMGTTGNNGNDDPDYATALGERVSMPPATQGPFRLGATYGTGFSDFDQAYNALSPGEGGGAGTAYTVRAGDTLESIARAMFGDTSLWYRIADANGLSGAAQLSAGQMLRIPAGLANVHNTSDTFRPYDSARHIGDTLPTTPKPPKKPNCGGFGQVLLAVVAVAVTLIALPSSAPTFMQGLLAGAAGSTASQTVGLATGIQDKFSFKGLALSALAGGVTAGLGDPDIVGKSVAKFMSTDKFFNAAIRGVVGNAVTQGVGVATGLQDRFDWAGVAAAGLGGGVASGTPGGRFVSITAGALAGTAIESLITGRDFGDTLVAHLPGIIGNTVGSLLADAVSKPRLGYADVGSNNGVIGGGTFGTGDGAAAQSTVGAGGGRAGGSAVEAQEGEIVVTASHRMDVLLHQMNDYQFGRYFQQYGNLSFEEGAVWALGLKGPQADYSSYWRGISGGQSIRSYSPSLYDKWNTAFLGRVHEAGLQFEHGGLGYVLGIGNYLLSGATSTLDMGLSYGRGRGGWVAPVDRQDTDFLAFMAGGVEAAGLTKLERLRSVGTSGGIEATYQARYAVAYERGLAKVDAQLAAGEIRAPFGQPEHLFKANRVDAFARADLKAFALDQGHGTDLVRINQRLYLEGTSGKYRVPDLYFPQSGMIFDGTLGAKTFRTPQIIDFRAATGNAPIGIVRPRSYGGFYWLGN
ncbi:MAG: LysM peptidoglycan-binding domain-containing protein [Novosphingobium sp.]